MTTPIHLPRGNYLIPGALWEKEGSEAKKARSWCALIANGVKAIALTGAAASIAFAVYAISFPILGQAGTFFSLVGYEAAYVLGIVTTVLYGDLFYAARGFKDLTHNPPLVKSLCDPTARTCSKEKAIDLLTIHLFGGGVFLQQLFETSVKNYLRRELL